MYHVIYTSIEAYPNRIGPVWALNGNTDRPTFSPSIRVRYPHGEPPQQRVCHYFIVDGQIRYCSDSTHALAGQTVDLPDLPV